MGNNENMEHQAHEDAGFGELLNYFVDGILGANEQIVLFEHLTRCESCRTQLEAIMTFRRASRLEYIQIPPSVDDAFFNKLAINRANATTQHQKDVDRSILSANVALSLRTVLIAASVVFIIGLFVPSNMASGDTKIVETRQERVNLAGSAVSHAVQEAVYVFYPGLTITAEPVVEDLDERISIHN
ncbi:MAG: zf-HC2 domain-containing protein [Rhodothermales bacterium]|nr:zf-HC2 domain-containing protein [Rhodothermales bacterium]